jgi:orotate phosphoribosyltransferase/uridine monophosphate synthetase
LSGLKVRDIVVLLDRQEGARERLKLNGYNLISILGLESLLNYLMASRKIEEDWYRKTIDYMSSRRTD